MNSIKAILFTSMLLVVQQVTEAQQEKDCSGFKSGSEEYVTVRYKESVRRGKIKKDVTQAEITWRPQDMLSDLSCFSLSETALLFKAVGQDEYETADVVQRSGGAAAKWYFDVKPCLSYQFAIKVVGETENIFELPQVLGPASDEEIAASSFVPSSPSGFNPNVGATMATLSWDRSDCATSYFVTYREVGTPDQEAKFVSSEEGATSVQVNDLKPCTNYEVTISAYLNEEAEESGDTVVNFATKPRLDAAKDMTVDVKTTMDTATITLQVWSASCINDFELSVCDNEQECAPTIVLTKAPGVPTITYTLTDLNPCTDYSLEVQPFYPETEIERKLVTFRTQSPNAASVQVGQINTVAVSSGSMLVSWPSVKCASSYKIYQKETEESEWTNVGDTSAQEVTIGNIAPCTQYHFAITAVLDGQETEKSVGEEIMSELDEEDPFEAPNLQIQNADRKADISWDHAGCIESYVLNVCQSAYVDCIKHDVTPDGSETITFTLENLEPCTMYSLEVIPVITGKIFTARGNDFTTTNGIPQPPQEFNAIMEGQTAKLSWNTVQCSTGYRVYYKTDDPESYEVTEDVNALNYNSDILQTCTTYNYAIATLVDEQESEKSEWQSLLIPPDSSVPPVLKILANENDNITLRLDPPEINKKCRADAYELNYSKNGAKPYETKVFPGTEIREDLVLSFPGATSPHAFVQGKIKYANTDLWSEIASSREPGDRSRVSQVPTDTRTLVPMVVGAVLAVIIIILIVTFFVRRKKRGSQRYDAEKAENGAAKTANSAAEETQKLNESHPDA